MHSALKPKLNCGVSLGAIAASLLLASVPAFAADQPVETVVVTGIRGSLESSMAVKRNASQVMDAISAEDIGKFPDKDMGEALQRVTGVQISRSSGGEGANVTIRGADPTMTRVEINGVGALSVTANSGDRAIDFRDLPVEFVSRLEVIKSPTADMVEGGLGGTVRVVTRRPFDNGGEPYVAGSFQMINSNLAQTWDPKFAAIGSKTFFGDKLGVLVSGTYEQSHQYDGQALTTGWLRQQKTTSAQGLPSNPCGSYFGTNAPTTCGAGYTDYTGTLQGDWYPQIPRYFNNRRNTLRYAINSVIEYRPTDTFKFYWDTTYARGYENVRNQALQLNANGGIFDYAKTTLGDDNTVNHIELTSNGSTFRSACNSTSSPNTQSGCLPLDLTFRNILGYLTRTQLTSAFGFEEEVIDGLTIDGRVDFARSQVDNQETDSVATQYGTTRAIVDYTGSEHAPNIQLPGTDLLTGSGVNEVYALYTPVTDTSRETTERLNVKYKPDFAPWLEFKAGYLRHDYSTKQVAFNHRVTLTCRGTASSGSAVVLSVPCSTITGILASNAGTNPIPFYNTGTLGFNDEARTWMDLNQDVVKATMAAAAAADPLNAASGLYNIYDMSPANQNTYPASTFKTYLSNWTVGEGSNDFYGMMSFDLVEMLPLPVSGNLGLRYVETNTTTTGYSQNTTAKSTTTKPSNCPSTIPTSPAPFSTPSSCVTYSIATIAGGYNELLPSANLKVDVIPEQVILRFAYGKVMSRAAPTQISLGRTLDVVGRTGKQGNPGLLPFMSTDYNIGAEWYFGKFNAVTVGVFQKDISRFIQNTSQSLDINNDGNPYLITYPVNGTTPVHIQGIEASVQYAFDWLPSPFDGFGMTANITAQKDKGFSTVSQLDGAPLPFPGLSKLAENASVYYENEDFSVRLSYVWRSKWLITALGRGNLPEYNKSYGELDASASYNINENLSIFADAINLTDSQLVQYNAPARPILFDTFGQRLYFGVRAKY
jgi:iron complex outermembrane recepter protein